MKRFLQNVMDQVWNIFILKDEKGWSPRIIVVGFQLGLTVVAFLNLYYVYSVYTGDLIFRFLSCTILCIIFIILTTATILEGYRLHFSKKETKQKDDLDGPTV